MSDSPTARNSTACILYVCTGNVCRSPYLELKTRSALTRIGVQDVQIASAGTDAFTGEPISRRMSEILRANHIATEGFTARRVEPQQIADADIVLTATREHRAVIAALDHSAGDRTFTVLQFLRLLRAVPELPREAVPAGALRSLVEDAKSARGLAGASTTADDIEDPWRKSQRVYRRVADQMDQALLELVARIEVATTPASDAAESALRRPRLA